MSKKRVYIDGIFDLFHRGHLESFYKTKNSLNGEEVSVVVGVISDSDAEGYKRLPIIKEDDRVAIIEALEIVDEVIFPAPLIITEDFINKNNIDMIVHGFNDQNDFENQKEFFRVPIKLNKFKTIQYYTETSTSDIIKNIKENY